MIGLDSSLGNPSSSSLCCELGLLPRRIRDPADRHRYQVPESSLLTPEKRKNVVALLREYYNSLCRHLQAENRELQNVERTNKRILLTKGEVRKRWRRRVFFPALDRPLSALHRSIPRGKRKLKLSMRTALSSCRTWSSCRTPWTSPCPPWRTRRRRMRMKTRRQSWRKRLVNLERERGGGGAKTFN